MDPYQREVVKQTNMGLRVADGKQLSMKENLKGDFELSDGKTKVMSVSTSGRPFNVNSNGKIEVNGRNDDIDESSSGYSSRESQYGEGQVVRFKPQKLVKPVILVKEADNLSINESKDNEECKLTIDDNENRGESSRSTNKTSESSSNQERQLFAAKEFDSLLPKTNIPGGKNEDVIDNQSSFCRKTCSTCSCSKEQGDFIDNQKIYRQPRVDLEDDTRDHLPPDKLVENGHPLYHEDREIISLKNRKNGELGERSTQTDQSVPELFEECSILKKLNNELEEKLKTANDEFDITIKRLEKQLVNAVSELTQLKKQLLSSVDSQANQFSPCTRCGYCSDGEVSELSPLSSKPNLDLLVANDIRRSYSTDNLSIRPRQRVARVSQQSNLLKYIFKGENPDKIKTSLLEKNKSLKDEIQTLKGIENVDATTSSKSTHNGDMVMQSGHESFNLLMDKRMSTEPEFTAKSNQKTLTEEVRWKQSMRIPRRPKKAATVHPQFTSAAFRTIHVTKWGPQI